LQNATRSVAFNEIRLIFRSRSLALQLRNGSITDLGAVKMLDLIFIAITVVFFAVALVYAGGCDRL